MVDRRKHEDQGGPIPASEDWEDLGKSAPHEGPGIVFDRRIPTEDDGDGNRDGGDDN